MLNAKEEKLVSKNVKDFYYFISLNASFFGEPFFENGYLYYFDGEVVALISPRVEGEITKANLNSTITKIIKKHSPQNLIFWGETPTKEINTQKGYKLDKRDLDLWKRELIFRTADFKSHKKYRQYLRKFDELGLEINHVKIPYYKAAYTKLIAETHVKNIGTKSLSFYSTYPTAKEVKFIEILKDKKIISINIIADNSPNYVCFAETGWDKDLNRISGIVKAKLIEYYLDKTKLISWGGAANEGIFNYKRELIGKDIPICFYENYIYYEFYKTNKKSGWWLERMAKEP